MSLFVRDEPKETRLWEKQWGTKKQKNSKKTKTYND